MSVEVVKSKGDEVINDAQEKLLDFIMDAEIGDGKLTLETPASYWDGSPITQDQFMEWNTYNTAYEQAVAKTITHKLADADEDVVVVTMSMPNGNTLNVKKNGKDIVGIMETPQTLLI